MKIAIITPVYLATEKVKQMCEAIDKNTSNEFVHILVDDSSPSEEHLAALRKLASNRRAILHYRDGVEPEKHRANITQALQMGYDHLKIMLIEFDHLFVVESDVMVPEEWDKMMITLSQLLPQNWLTLDVMPVDEEDKKTYPAAQHNVKLRDEIHDGKNFEVTLYSDWNAILFNPFLLVALKMNLWKFNEVPSHHDILLSRKFRELIKLSREPEEGEEVESVFFRTPDVRAVHYANSSRSLLPEGLSTPSNPR